MVVAVGQLGGKYSHASIYLPSYSGRVYDGSWDKVPSTAVEEPNALDLLVGVLDHILVHTSWWA